MNTKTGPYGSHYGQGCYTKNCRLRDASDANVFPPLSYDEAQKNLENTYARMMTAKGVTKFGETNTALDNARAAVNATPEGLKRLQASLKHAEVKHGKNSGVALSVGEDIRKAKNLRDQNDVNFRQAVFNARQSVMPEDLKYLAKYSERYGYKPAFNGKGGMLVDTKTGEEIVKVDEQGNFYPKESATIKPTSKSSYSEIKQQISNKVVEDSLLTINSRPSPNSAIKDVISKSYETVQKSKADGSYRTIVKDKNGRGIAVAEYDSNSNFKSVSWAKDKSGALNLPEKNPIVFLRMLKNKEFDSKPSLPSYLVG